jgi:phenylacetate-CoA ligase
MPGIAWPPLTGPQHAPLALVAERLERSQWFDPDVLRAGQFRQLAQLAAYAGQHSTLFAARLRDAGLTSPDVATADGFAALPLLTRTMLQGDPATIDCALQPIGHSPLIPNASSGSTGEPVTVRRTQATELFWQGLTLRWHFWAQSPVGGRLAVIRAGISDPGHKPNWGSPLAQFFPSGSALTIDATTDYETIAAQLAAFDPHALVIYPSILMAMLDRMDAGALVLPSLQSAMLLGEAVPDAVRKRARGRIAISSCYSSMEVGYLTLQCPESGLHHIMSETNIVEVLGSDGQPAVEGETGRVVTTDLHNFATPLIRYEIGDWAQVGPACPCGRGLPTLARIFGRTRNMMILPDGRTRWAMTGSIRYQGIAPLRQMQMIQHSRGDLEIRYVADAELDAEDTNALMAAVMEATDPNFAVRLTQVEGRLDNAKTGKFEEFISRIL